LCGLEARGQSACGRVGRIEVSSAEVALDEHRAAKVGAAKVRSDQN
jgi:hypothetical protein